MFQVITSLLGSWASWWSPARAEAACPDSALHETQLDCPWAGVARKLQNQKISPAGLKQIKATIRKSIPGFLDQLERDRKASGLADLWGTSRNIDESSLPTTPKPSVTRIVPENLLRAFTSIWPLPFAPDYTEGHAGLTHTYGYLFSTLQTPYGYKRARYVKGEIEAGFGLPAGLLGGLPTSGTLLQNLTYFAGRIAFRPGASESPGDARGLQALEALAKSPSSGVAPAVLNFDYASLKPKRLLEQLEIVEPVPPGGKPEWATRIHIEMRTDLVPFLHSNPTGKNSALLIHSIAHWPSGALIRVSPPAPRLITVFPVEASFAERLFDPNALGEKVPMKARYNAVLPHPVPAEQMFGKRSIQP